MFISDAVKRISTIPLIRANFALVGALLLLLASGRSSAEPPGEVQAALDWQMPTNRCQKPDVRGNLDGIPALGGSVRHLGTNTTAETFGTPVVSDVDPMEIARYERQRNRWERCVRKYKEGLLEHFEQLKSSAKHGLTRSQAKAIARKLVLIQAAILSPDGVINEKEPSSPQQQTDAD